MTYKHIWISCNNCRNIVRQLRDKFFLEFVAKWLSERSDSKTRLNPKGIRAKLYYILGRWGEGNVYMIII